MFVVIFLNMFLFRGYILNYLIGGGGDDVTDADFRLSVSQGATFEAKAEEVEEAKRC